MSQAARKVVKVKRKIKQPKGAQQKHTINPYISTFMQAGMATPAPPIGPTMARRGINVNNFCKEFNSLTDNIIPGKFVYYSLYLIVFYNFSHKTKRIYKILGVPLPTTVCFNPDRTFKILTKTPPASWLIMHAAGIRRGGEPGSKIILPDSIAIITDLGETAGMISLRHVYEIAKIKKQDRGVKIRPLKDICLSVIRQAWGIGIEVRDRLDAKELEEFLQKRKQIVEDKLKENADKRAAKLLRATTAPVTTTTPSGTTS